MRGSSPRMTGWRRSRRTTSPSMTICFAEADVPIAGQPWAQPEMTIDGAAKASFRRDCAIRRAPRSSLDDGRSLMDAPYSGRALRRLEDARFLTGRGRYLDDVAAADALH